MNIEQERATQRAVTGLFEALHRRDSPAVIDLYTSDARFRDPVLGDLPPGAVRTMWSSFLAHTDCLTVGVTESFVRVHIAHVDWKADYRVLATGRHVQLNVRSKLICLGSRISSHEDQFDSWAWARMAHGVPGILMGWNPIWRQRQVHPGRVGYSTPPVEVRDL